MKKLFNTILLLAMVVAMLVVVIGCESKSGKINREPDIKVVIIDSQSRSASGGGTNYKVKVISQGVVAYVHSFHRYETGDTIFTKKSLLNP